MLTLPLPLCLWGLPVQPLQVYLDPGQGRTSLASHTRDTDNFRSVHHLPAAFARMSSEIGVKQIIRLPDELNNKHELKF